MDSNNTLAVELLQQVLRGKFIVKLNDDKLCTVWEIKSVVVRHSSSGGYVDMVLVSQVSEPDRLLLLDLVDIFDESYFSGAMFITLDAASAEAAKLDNEDAEDEEED